MVRLNQAVDAVGQGGFSAAGRAGNQNLLALMYRQVNVVQGGFGLGGVLKAKIPERENGRIVHLDTS